MSRGLEHYLSHLVTQKEWHLTCIQSWMKSGNMDDMSYYHFHDDGIAGVKEQIERVLNLLERD